MDDRDLILDDREKLYSIINKYSKEYNIVTLKANIPGLIKNTSESKILLMYFNNMILKYKPNNIINHHGKSGDALIYLFKNTKNLKKDMIKLENTSLGRFVDIDFYFNDNKSIKRKHPRKCYLCNNIAFYCIKNNTHTYEELNNYIVSSVHNYLKKEIEKALHIAFTKELFLYPKFGLVSFFSKGSHKDMNYSLMTRSRDAIIPYLIDMFDVGYLNEIDSILNKIRYIGKLAEAKMYSVTNGVNTYKGLIFGLGIISASVGYYLKHLNELSIEDVIKIISSPIQNDFIDNPNSTQGLIAYNSYGIKGARGIAIDGYNIVFDLLKNNNLKTKNDLYEALFKFVNESEDTVLLKRCGNFDKYIYVKGLFKEYDRSLVKPLTKYSIKNNLSFGGSADLLSISIFLKEASQRLGLTYMN